MTAPVFLAGTDLSDVVPGDTWVLEGAEARHAGVVQRRRPGEQVDVVDGEGVRLCCRITAVEPGRVELEVSERVVEPRPTVRLLLAQALAKGDRDELAVEAATEVGVDEVVPWQASRSVVVWRGDRAARSHAKWRATIREATKQSRRARKPLLAEPVDTRGLARVVADVVADGGVVAVLHESATTALADVPLPTPSGTAGTDAPGGSTTAPGGSTTAPGVLVVVGPEGGIADDELASLTAACAVAARLGPHVLRTSTAGPVALALLAVRLGRWGVTPP